MSWTKRSALAAVSSVSWLGLMAAGGGTGPASAAPITTHYTFSGTATEFGQSFIYNCSTSAGGPGYVESAEHHGTIFDQPKIEYLLAPGLVALPNAETTAPYKFGSRVVTAIRVDLVKTVTTPAKYEVTVYCTSEESHAWFVFG
jgi:hypothetical protein